MLHKKINFKILDLVLIAFYLAISLAGGVYFMVEGLSLHDLSTEVVISLENEEVERIKLPVSEKREIVIDTKLGHNTIIIEGKYVHMAHSDCADQICVHQGEISLPNEMIVCLPNELLIEIKGIEQQEVDQIAQ